jgi:hypothetical protein
MTAWIAGSDKLMALGNVRSLLPADYEVECTNRTCRERFFQYNMQLQIIVNKGLIQHEPNPHETGCRPAATLIG